MDINAALGLFGFLLACFAAASTGAVFQPGTWYERLSKPAWVPPNWLFPVAWAALYVMIAMAGWLVWRAAGFSGAPLALGLWAVQLVLNAAWSWIFFGLKRMDWALAELVVLWAAILATILAFTPVSTTAAWLMAPYLAWISFAGFLNLAMIRLNRQRVPARAA